MNSMFADNYYSYALWTNSSTRVDQPDTWKQVTLRLADTASAVAGYRMGDTYWADSASVSAWALESSADGVTWMKMDERDYSKTFAEEIASFMRVQANGGNYSPNAFAFTSDYKSGAFFRHAGAVSVAAGAKLDLDGIADANVTIASLSAKYGEANGTITYFSPAEEGTLYLTDVPEGTDLNRLTIPFAFTRKSSDAAAKIATWTLYANGEPVRDATLILTDDGLKVKIPHGLLLLFR